MAPASKRKKPAKKSAAKPRRPAKAKRSQGAAKRASARDPSASDLVYSDIRRSMHGAILRHLR